MRFFFVRKFKCVCALVRFTRELPTTISGMWMKTAASIHHTNENKISLSLLFRCFINFKSGKCILLWMITRYRIACVYKLHVVIVNDLCFINYFECHANISIFLSAIEFFFLKKKKLIVHFNTTMAGLHFSW